MVLAHRQVKHTGDPQEQVLPVEQPAGQTAAWEERDDNRETDGGTGCIRGRNNEDQGGCEMQPWLWDVCDGQEEHEALVNCDTYPVFFFVFFSVQTDLT